MQESSKKEMHDSLQQLPDLSMQLAMHVLRNIGWIDATQYPTNISHGVRNCRDQCRRPNQAHPQHN